MFSYSAFSERAFSELDFAQSEAAKIIAQYFSDKGYITDPDDMPASQYFEPAVAQPLLFFRNMIGDRMGGIVSGQNGSIILTNTDGGLDQLLQNYGIDGRRVVVKMGAPGFAYDDFGIIFDGIASSWESSEKAVQIDLQDKLIYLNRNIQPNTYQGTGGIEGGDDLKDKPKPLCFGKVFNVPAIPVDTANLVYQVHDGQINNVPAVYDRGVSITFDQDYTTSAELLSAVIAGGEYATCLAEGLFRLGGSPAGIVTSDVEGAADPSYYVVTSDIVKFILKRYSALLVADLDLASFLSFFNDNTSTVGLWIDTTPRLILDVIAELLAGVSGFITSDRFGRIQAGIFKLASGQPEIELTDEHILDIEQEPLPSGIYPPNWRRQVAYQRNYTVQTDIAGSVDADRRAFISQPARIATSADAITQTRHVFATDPPVVSGLFVNEADALAESQRLLELYKDERHIYRIRTRYCVYNYYQNQVISLTFPRWDLAAGKIGRVVAIDLDAQRNDATLRVFV